MEKYRLQRKLIAGAYSPAFIRKVEGNLDNILGKNVDVMAQRTGTSVNVDTFFELFASG
jgi:hypothetical protein